MRYAYFLITLLWITSVFADEVFLLTKSLDFIPEGSKRQITIRPKDQPTLIRKLSEKNGITEVEIFQENGKSVSKRMTISTKWLSRGTQSNGLTEFTVDPNPIVANLNPDCDKKEEASEPVVPVVPSAEACKVLSSGEQDVEKHIECFASIQQRLDLNNPSSSYKTLSKLYTLSPEEQKFMAYILTMYGEARGLDPVEQQMAAIAKVIDNRTKYAQSEFPNASELDVVLQNSQFSMYNPRDPNWKTAISADPAEMRDAIRVFATKAMDSCTTADNVYHYATTDLCRSRARPRWATPSRKVTMDFTDLSGLLRGHTFFADVAWNFAPSNRYKDYAEENGLL